MKLKGEIMAIRTKYFPRLVPIRTEVDCFNRKITIFKRVYKNHNKYTGPQPEKKEPTNV